MDGLEGLGRRERVDWASAIREGKMERRRRGGGMFVGGRVEAEGVGCLEARLEIDVGSEAAGWVVGGAEDSKSSHASSSVVGAVGGSCDWEAFCVGFGCFCAELCHPLLE